MLLPDVNVLLYAHVDVSNPEHDSYADWVSRVATGPEPFAFSVLVIAEFVRVVTNPRIFEHPSPPEHALGFVTSLTKRPTARIIGPGPDHLEIFTDLWRRSGAVGNLAADAQHAAVAMEHGCTIVSTDSDFDRFPGLRWQHRFRPHAT